MTTTTTTTTVRNDLTRAISIRGLADVDALAAMTGFVPENVEAALQEMVADAIASDVGHGRYRLTPEGQLQAGSLQQTEVEAVADGRLEPCYSSFGTLNAAFKKVVGEWQMARVGMSSEPIDDDTVVATITSVHVDVTRVIDEVALEVDRFAGYRRRLDAALERIRGGDLDAVASPLGESYHTVWFELHEDLIRITGRSRSDEPDR